MRLRIRLARDVHGKQRCRVWKLEIFNERAGSLEHAVPRGAISPLEDFMHSVSDKLLQLPRWLQLDTNHKVHGHSHGEVGVLDKFFRS